MDIPHDEIRSPNHRSLNWLLFSLRSCCVQIETLLVVVACGLLARSSRTPRDRPSILTSPTPKIWQFNRVFPRISDKVRQISNVCDWCFVFSLASLSLFMIYSLNWIWVNRLLIQIYTYKHIHLYTNTIIPCTHVPSIPPTSTTTTTEVGRRQENHHSPLSLFFLASFPHDQNSYTASQRKIPTPHIDLCRLFSASSRFPLSHSHLYSVLCMYIKIHRFSFFARRPYNKFGSVQCSAIQRRKLT